MTTAIVSRPIPLKKISIKTEAKAATYQSVNPFNGKVLKTFKELTDAQLENAIKTAAT